MIEKEQHKIIFKKIDAWYDKEFNFEELQLVLDKCKDSAPGKDQIMYSFLKNMGEVAKRNLLDFYNNIWVKEEFPQS